VLSIAWGPVVRQIAAGLGAEVDEVREVHEKRATDTAFDIPAGRVPAGTMAALRFEVQAIVKGRPAIVLEHVTRLRDDLAPEWPQPPGHGCYRVIIEGNPTLKVDLTLAGDDGDHNTGGLVATAMRILNAIPAVCAAKPGLLSALDLPLLPARHLMR
jgi:4-hydroxy-tetrahydrodipicolinate reductase